jgi:hypothetical protein
MMLSLNPQIWWPLFPLLLLVVVVSLSAAVTWTIRKKRSKSDFAIQLTALLCYLLTAVVAIAGEGGALSPQLHRVPSLLTQAVILAQLIRLWRQADARVLRSLNMVAWGAILTDTALHYIMTKG